MLECRYLLTGAQSGALPVHAPCQKYILRFMVLTAHIFSAIDQRSPPHKYLQVSASAIFGSITVVQLQSPIQRKHYAHSRIGSLGAYHHYNATRRPRKQTTATMFYLHYLQSELVSLDIIGLFCMEDMLGFETIRSANTNVACFQAFVLVAIGPSPYMRLTRMAEAGSAKSESTTESIQPTFLTARKAKQERAPLQTHT